MYTKVISAFAVLLVAVFSTTVVSSVDAKPFYKGKRIVFLGNYVSFIISCSTKRLLTCWTYVQIPPIIGKYMTCHLALVCCCLGVLV